MSSRNSKEGKGLEALDRLIEEITVDADGDDERLRAFRQAFEDEVALPADGFVIGEPVSIIAVDYGGNERRGLTAKCRREDGSEYVIAAADVVLPQSSAGARCIAAYRRWLNLDPYPAEIGDPSRPRRQHKAEENDIDLSKPVELVVLAVKKRGARCRLPGIERIITLRAGRLWTAAPGTIVTVEPRKQWRYGGHPYLSGEIQSVRIDAGALELVPLGLEDMGLWDPGDEYGGENDEPLGEWCRTIMAQGPRPMFKMEQVLTGEALDDPFNAPTIRAVYLNDNGDKEESIAVLMQLCQADLRCLDAHAHLGDFAFERNPVDAVLHYEVGLRIGELSLGENFAGVLPWSFIGNRPFLRCMHGYGFCLWRLGRFDEAERTFQQMLRLNPSDDQGVRFLIDEVRAKKAWEDREVE
ncbi:MAG: cytoplasmic protein [Acidobacteria bacterium]|nr:cytoplasmic protein [Acidobacteriota bacterium]